MRRSNRAQAPELQISVINETGNLVQVQEKRRTNGDKALEVKIDQMVSHAMSGGTQTRKVLKTMFGIEPALSKR